MSPRDRHLAGVGAAGVSVPPQAGLLIALRPELWREVTLVVSGTRCVMVEWLSKWLMADG